MPFFEGIYFFINVANMKLNYLCHLKNTQQWEWIEIP